jgi:hypothetical protein
LSITDRRCPCRREIAHEDVEGPEHVRVVRVEEPLDLDSVREGDEHLRGQRRIDRAGDRTVVLPRLNPFSQQPGQALATIVEVLMPGVLLVDRLGRDRDEEVEQSLDISVVDDAEPERLDDVLPPRLPSACGFSSLGQAAIAGACASCAWIQFRWA